MTQEEAVIKLREYASSGKQAEVDLASQRVTGRIDHSVTLEDGKPKFKLHHGFGGDPTEYHEQVLGIRPWHPGW